MPEFITLAKADQIPDGEELWKLFLVIALNKIRDLGDYHRAAKRNIQRTVGLESSGQATPANIASDEDSLQVLNLTIDDLLESMSPSQRAVQCRPVSTNSKAPTPGSPNRATE